MLIGLSIEDNQLNFVRKAKSAKEAWDNLKNHHEKSTLTSKVQLMKKICSLKYDESSKIENHIEEMITLFDKLEALGEKII